MSKPLRLVFMGSPAFAVPALRRVLADGHTVVLVVTQPDRPAGRGYTLRPPAVKVLAEEHRLSVLQPERLEDAAVMEALNAARPEVIVVVAFGQFLPKAVRELPPLGCVNVHASLLPKYRGAAPINWALIRGETVTGVSIMRVEAAMDAGPVLVQRRVPIAADDDAGSLHDRLAGEGAAALSEGLGLLAEGRAVWRPQDGAQATHAPKITDAECRLSLPMDPTAFVNRVRGLAPSPGAYLPVRAARGQRLKILRAAARPAAGAPGRILEIAEPALVVGTGPGAVALLEVQPEGKRRMTGAEFARGQRLVQGESVV
jgi:methionyl-tRNA formyltransferase